MEDLASEMVEETRGMTKDKMIKKSYLLSFSPNHFINGEGLVSW
jgi:hypothetical protein